MAEPEAQEERSQEEPAQEEVPREIPPELAERIARLSPQKRALLLKQLTAGKKPSAPAAEEGIRPLPRTGEDRFPVSFSQLREWILDRLDPGSSAYNIPATLSLEGELDAGAMARAVVEIVRRHESLRTTFEATAEGEPVQVVAPEPTLTVPLVDLTGVPDEPRRRLARRLAERELRRPFDLARGPLIRVTLLELEPREHWLVLVMHHIVSDGWSMGVFAGEVGTLYEAFAAGRPSPLPPLPIQYPDFAAWQRRRLRGEALEELTAYWRRQLQGSPGVLELPADRPRPPVRSGRGDQVPFLLGEEVSRAAAALARRSGASLFMVLLAALDTLLARYTGQTDLAVGTFIANRNRSETRPLIGFFVNTLVLRVDLSGDPTFAAALERVKQVALDAYAHQDLPFERVLEAVHPDRDQSRTPLFQVMCVLQNMPVATQRLEGLTLRPVEIRRRHADFDLVLWAGEGGARIGGSLEYSTDLFDAATLRRLRRHLERLMAAAVAEPERPLSHLPLLAPAEEQQLVREWNDTAWAPERRPGPAEPVTAGLARQAGATPEAVALVAGAEHLSYGAFGGRVVALAGELTGSGVGPEEVVGVAVEPSAGAVTALLAVLQAGGAYLPLDPALPADRLAFLLADAGAGRVLVDDAATAALQAPAEREGAALLPLSEDRAVPRRSRPAGPPLDPSERWPAPEQLAYVIYTSGSTGRPKGVAVPHRALAAFTAAAAQTHAVGPGDRVLQFASLAFDASAEEIYPTLTRGATLVLRRQSLASAAELAALAAEAALTVLDLPTAYWHSLVTGTAGLPLPPSVRRVILGGEAVAPEGIDAWRRQGLGARLVNTYGPTEATVVATAGELAGAGPAPRRVPMGRPLAGVRAYLVDRRLRPVPLGVPGELLLAGPGVARGYLGRPGLTAERFVPDPFATAEAAAGGRLYRTGDLARHLPGGELEFAGRTDQQVKVRGFRVEPGEIAAALAAHPAVREAVVVARRGGDGAVGSGAGGPGTGAVGAAADTAPLRLVAYYVPAAGAVDAPGEGALRAFLAQRLPAYMLPAAFLALDAFPLTPQGKLDRRALPAPEGRRRDPEAAFVPPSNDTERALAALWRELLGVEKVGARDNFFELGGDSLLLLRLHERVTAELGVELSVLELFRYPTVETLAGRLTAGVATRSVEEVRSETARRLDRASERRQRLQQRRRPGASRRGR